MANQARIIANGATRTAVGLTILTRPATTIRLTGVDRVTAEKLAWLARLAAIRDLAIGIGLLHAHTTGAPTRGWLTAGMLADAADAAVFTHATARGQLPPAIGAAMAAAAAGGVALAAPAARRGDPPTSTGLNTPDG